MLRFGLVLLSFAGLILAFQGFNHRGKGAIQTSVETILKLVENEHESKLIELRHHMSKVFF